MVLKNNNSCYNIKMKYCSVFSFVKQNILSGYNIKTEILLSILCYQKKKKKFVGIIEKVKHYQVFCVIKKKFFFSV